MVVVSSTFSVPAEGVIFQTPSIKLLVNDEEMGTGTLYITETNVLWGNGLNRHGGPAPTISLLYPSISLHAIQREPTPALYLLLNYELRLPEWTLGLPAASDAQQEVDDDDDFEADVQPLTQLRFLPQSDADLDSLYAAMCQGQTLHPDPADEVEDPYMDSEEMDEAEEEFEDAEEANGAAEDTAARLRALRLDQPNGPQQPDCEDEAAEE